MRLGLTYEFTPLVDTRLETIVQGILFLRRQILLSSLSVHLQCLSKVLEYDMLLRNDPIVKQIVHAVQKLFSAELDHPMGAFFNQHFH